MSGAIDLITDLLRRAHTDDAAFPATTLYEEGWLLRLVLAATAKVGGGAPLAFEPGARWYSEARLYSPFAPVRRGDGVGETHTHADAVVGHFRIAPGTKTGFQLLPSATQFIAVEAKIFSGLAKRVTNAPEYDQAARYVACMAHCLATAKVPLTQLTSLAFLVLVPASRRSARLDGMLDKEAVRKRVAARVARMQEHRPELRDWMAQHFDPVLDRLVVKPLSWEDVIGGIAAVDAQLGSDIREFYARTLVMNGAPRALTEIAPASI